MILFIEITVLLIFAVFSNTQKYNYIQFEEFIKYCYYELDDNRGTIETNNKTLVKKLNNNVEIHLKLCGQFEDNNICPINSTACLKYSNSNKIFNLGSNFHLSNDYYLYSINGEFCMNEKNYTLKVFYQRKQQNSTNSIYLENNNCSFQIGIYVPVQKFTSCKLRLFNRLFDLSPLAKTFQVLTPQRNFSISICSPNPICNNNNEINACEINNNNNIEKIIPISEISTFTALYSGDKNEISFSGHTFNKNNSRKNVDKKLFIRLKCDWDKIEYFEHDLKYVPKSMQGSKFEFILESSYGCVKKPTSCILEVKNQNLVYDLSNLYKNHTDLWIVDGLKNNKYNLQICGPLHQLNSANGSCNTTHSQICEINNNNDGNNFINRGSILTQLTQGDDSNKIIATIESGSKCSINNFLNNVFSKTIIEFTCNRSTKLGEPKFVEFTNCITYFTWKTSYACPKYNFSASCSVHPTQYNNCIFEGHNGNIFNLTTLTNKTKTIEHKINANLIFKLNLCRTISSNDIPCNQRSSSVLLLDDSNSVNLNQRYKSLGKFYKSKMDKENLILEYKFGYYCAAEGKDYSSEVIIQCSEFEEDPILVEYKECFFKFLWKTPFGCVANNFNENKCIFYDAKNDKSINFDYIRPINLLTKSQNFTIFLCQRTAIFCDLFKNECKTKHFENNTTTVLFNSSITTLVLKESCKSSADIINKIIVTFNCDLIENNQHLNSWNKTGCDLNINYFTHKVCAAKIIGSSSVEKTVTEKFTNPVAETDLSTEKIIFPVDATVTEKPKLQECPIIESPFTNYKVNTENLTFVKFSKKYCPKATFNDTYRFVKLLYETEEDCSPIISTKRMSYVVYLRCSEENNKIISTKDEVPINKDCLVLYNFQKIDYCNYFKNRVISHAFPNSIILSTVGSLLIVSGLLCFIYVLSRRYGNFCNRSRLRCDYIRNSEL